jgi:hypothetical protein
VNSQKQYEIHMNFASHAVDETHTDFASQTVDETHWEFASHSGREAQIGSAKPFRP